MSIIANTGMESFSTLNRESVFLNNEIIIANRKAFSILVASVTNSKKEISYDNLNQALKWVASMGGLHGAPSDLVAITEKESVIYAHIEYSYTDNSKNNLSAKINGFRGEVYWPNLDVFLTNLTKSHDPRTLVPIIIVDPTIKLAPYGQNLVDDSVKKINKNPFKGLEKFVGKKYDGSLNIPELDKFKGFKFGNSEWAYTFNALHRGKDLGATMSRSKLPKLGEKLFDLYDSDWEIQAINHKEFDDSFTNKDKKYAKKEFKQDLTLILKHLEYHPPLTPTEQMLKIVENDKLFWTKMAYSNGFELKEIEPQYVDKEPLTPWYEATHKDTGKKIILGTRYRVYNVHDKHISKGSPEEVNQYLAELSKL